MAWRRRCNGMSRYWYHKQFAEHLTATWGNVKASSGLDAVIVGVSAVENWVDTSLGALGIHPRQDVSRLEILRFLSQVEGDSTWAPIQFKNSVAMWWLAAKSILERSRLPNFNVGAAVTQLDQIFQRDPAGHTKRFLDYLGLPQAQR